jgi:hypothetical protein
MWPAAPASIAHDGRRSLAFAAEANRAGPREQHGLAVLVPQTHDNLCNAAAHLSHKVLSDVGACTH